jgi:hypothetical protein
MAVYKSGLLIASALASEGGFSRLSRRFFEVASGDRSKHTKKLERRKAQMLSAKEQESLLKSVLSDDWRE